MAKARSTWFRFSLRTMLLITLLFGVTVGWIGAKRIQSTRQRNAVQAIDQLVGGREGYILWSLWDAGGSECESASGVIFDAGHFHNRKNAKTIFPLWVQRLTGEEWLHQAVEVNLANHYHIDDDDLLPLRSLRHVNRLKLDQTSITDAALQHISHLKHLQQLSLCGTRITDKSVSILESFNDLQQLNLSATDITDAGILRLRSLAQLSSLNICRTKVNPVAVVSLQRALPSCEIWWDGRTEFQLINSLPVRRGSQKLNPLSLIRLVNGLHGQGKDRVIEILRVYAAVPTFRYTRLYEDERLSYVVPLLFPYPPSQPTTQPGPHKNASWPDSYSAVRLQGEIPFYNYGSRGIGPYPITPKAVDWIVENCDLRKQPLRPFDNPFAQATLLHAKMCEELGSEQEEVRESLAEHLQEQAERMVSHLDLENPEEANLRWSDERQEYVLAEEPTASNP